MKSIAQVLVPVCAVFFMVQTVQAAPAPPRRNLDPASNADKPIAVNADSFLADLNGETGTYTGNVIVTQGTVRLHADQIKVTAPGGKASRMEALGHVILDSPSGQAVGDTGIYDVTGQVLRLNGHVVLTKDANVMRGSALEVSMETGLAHLTAAAEAQGQPPGRVQGLFSTAPRPAGGPAPAAATPAKP